ncbi:MAG: EAL domain-containing protein, partial [Litoreibacter sp.]|nr:EAL domain-containing protein [Litoreibacter sp.]
QLQLTQKLFGHRLEEEIHLQTVALEDAQQEMEHQATHDALTGVRNRRGLNEALDELIKHGEGQETGACVLHVDLDRFKGINDTLGHAAGDFVLQHVATVLKELSGEDAIIARVGGDEFVIAFACAHCGKRGLDLANSIVARAAEPVIFQGKECQIGASVGVAAPPYGGRTSSELLVNSDIALYRAKNAGRNRAQLFDADLAHEVEEQKELADAVTIGLARGEFVPVYQPQFCAQTHDLIGVETLARWQHPEKGLLTPDKFLGIAEGLGAVARIDAQIFESAVHECLALYQHGIEIPAVSFNVSIDRVRHPKLVQHMKELGPLPFAIGFELLESIFIEEEDDLFLMRLDQLRDLGARIELDDFGSGRASIIALTRIGADRLKIDQRLVRPIEESESARRLIKACIDIGSALGIGVLAEGVETPGQADILRELGCSCFQGYLYAKPMRMDDLRSFLAKEAWRTQPKATLRTA